MSLLIPRSSSMTLERLPPPTGLRHHLVYFMPFHFIFITFPRPRPAFPTKPPDRSTLPFRPSIRPRIPLRSRVEVDYFTAVDAYRAEAP